MTATLGAFTEELKRMLGTKAIDIDAPSCTAYTVQQMLTNAQYALVVRDGFASFFFHPYWLEPGLGVPAMSDFESLVSGITQLGYTWVDATTAQ